MKQIDDLKQIASAFPSDPGVYIMKDDSNVIIYISTGINGKKMPDLIGQVYSEDLISEFLDSNCEVVIMYEENNLYQDGYIINQLPSVDKTLTETETIIIYVTKESQGIEMPNMYNWTFEETEEYELANNLYFEYVFEYLLE